MNDAEYRRVESHLDEALAIFAEREAQFSSFIMGIRDNVARARVEVGELRAAHGRLIKSSRKDPNADDRE